MAIAATNGWQLEASEVSVGYDRDEHPEWNNILSSGGFLVALQWLRRVRPRRGLAWFQGLQRANAKGQHTTMIRDSCSCQSKNCGH